MTNPESSNMRKRSMNSLENEDEQQRPMQNWLQIATDVSNKKCVIPIGPGFQANVPAWNETHDKENLRNTYIKDSDSICLKQRGWTAKDPERGERIGAGRPDLCNCNKPGSIDCVRSHISDKRTKLRIEIAFMFFAWGFDTMGESVSRSWNKEEQERFESLVKLNPISQGKSFLEPAIKRIVTKNRQTIINYYFNVYLLRRMGTQIRSGNYVVDTDDENGEEEASPSGKKARNKRSRDNKLAKTKYLMGPR